MAGLSLGPVSTRDPASGLIDDEGYFHRHQDAWSTIDLDAAREEMVAQVGRAVSAGIDLTHVDTHMCSVLHASLADEYAAVGFARRVPALLIREPGWLAACPSRGCRHGRTKAWSLSTTCGSMPLEHRGRFARARATVFDELPPGLTHLILHPADDTPELRAITPDWRQRVADFETFRDRGSPTVRRAGVEMSAPALRDLMRARQPSGRRRDPMYSVTVVRVLIAQHYLVGGDLGRENELNSHRYQIVARYEGPTSTSMGSSSTSTSSRSGWTPSSSATATAR